MSSDHYGELQRSRAQTRAREEMSARIIYHLTGGPSRRFRNGVLGMICLFSGAGILTLACMGDKRRPSVAAAAPQDAILEAQIPGALPHDRPEQQKTAHDQSAIFSFPRALKSSAALATQPDQGRILGFDPYRDSFSAKRPGLTFSAVQRSGDAGPAGRAAPALDPAAAGRVQPHR
jgi:hypothetical protein